MKYDAIIRTSAMMSILCSQVSLQHRAKLKLQVEQDTCNVRTNGTRHFFRDSLLGAQTYQGFDIHFTRSRDVIDRVTNRFAIGYFLLVVHCHRSSISNRFQDIRPQIPVLAHTHAASDLIFSPMQCIALDRQ